MSMEGSMQSCIWECVYEKDCQTAVYFNDINVCSRSNGIQSSGNIRASVICYPKTYGQFLYTDDIKRHFVFLIGPSVTCSSTIVAVSTMATSTIQGNVF